LRFDKPCNRRITAENAEDADKHRDIQKGDMGMREIGRRENRAFGAWFNILSSPYLH
jgi:hypothetical protein